LLEKWDKSSGTLWGGSREPAVLEGKKGGPSPFFLTGRGAGAFEGIVEKSTEKNEAWTKGKVWWTKRIDKEHKRL